MSERSAEARATRFGVRIRRHLATGLIGGLVLGAAVGGVTGALVFGAGTRAFWAALIAGALFVSAVAVLVGGYASLESPDPGTEPSQSDRPVADRPGLTRVEHPVDGPPER